VLIVEGDDNKALANGMRAFQVSAARRLNAAIGVERNEPARVGEVFPDVYFAEELTSPRQVRNAIAYVLNNWRHHGEDRRSATIDPYASGIFFDGWAHRRWPYAPPEGYEPLPVMYPHTWLLAEGWRKHALIDPWAIPGARR
jgi:putative transposase